MNPVTKNDIQVSLTDKERHHSLLESAGFWAISLIIAGCCLAIFDDWAKTTYAKSIAGISFQVQIVDFGAGGPPSGVGGTGPNEPMKERRPDR